MMPERDYIMRVVYPTLIEEAAQHNVTVTFIDLRWGITEEESKAGKVIEICMNEIDYSRPFFIGLIGTRYGWTPQEKDIANFKDVVSKYPFLQDYIQSGLSVTEMEMRYGVLDDDKNCNALFFIRQSYEDYTDIKLKNLCDLIKNSTNSTYHYYEDLNTLGEKIVTQFRAYLDKEFPKETDTLFNRTKERLELIVHNHSTNYYGQLPDLQLNEAHDPLRICFVAKEGEGKTALMASMANILNQDSNIRCVFYSDEENITSKSFEALIDFLASSLIEDKKVYASPWEKLKVAIGSTEDKENLFFIFDGVCNLKGCSDEKLLKLIKIIGKANILISIDANSEYIPIFTRVGFDVRKIEIAKESFKGIIINYLSKFGKNLSASQIATLLKAKYDSFAELYSKLDYLRENASFESLNDDIEYLSKITVEGLFDVKLAYHKSSFGAETVDLFFEMMLCVSRGLKDSELCELLSLSPLKWTMLRNSCKNILNEADGNLNLNKYFNRYLTEHQFHLTKKETIDKLIAFFKSKNGVREKFILTELYQQGGYNQNLYSFILNYANFKPMFEEDEYSLSESWHYLLSTDNAKYSLDAYDDIEHIKIVNIPVKADHGLIAQFIKRHFPAEHALFNALIKHNEYRNNEVGVLMQFFNEDNVDLYALSPDFLLSRARNSTSIMDAIEKYKEAMTRFKVEQRDSYNKHLLISKEEALAIFTACLELAKIALTIKDYSLIRQCLEDAKEILSRHLSIHPKYYIFNGEMASTFADYFITIKDSSPVILTCQELLSLEEIENQDDLAFKLRMTKMRASMGEEEINIDDIIMQSNVLLHQIDTTFGRRNEHYKSWLLNQIIFYCIINDFSKVGEYFKEYRDLANRLIYKEDFSFLNLSYERTQRIMFDLYEAVDDIAAMKWYARDCNPKDILWCNKDLIGISKKLVKSLISNPEDKENDYLCRLLFPYENVYKEDKLFSDLFSPSDINQTELSDAYEGFLLLIESLGLDMLPKDLYDFFKYNGPTKACHLIHLKIIEVWRTLFQIFPSELDNADILDDDAMLDIAEANDNIAPYLITLIQFLIEIEGFHISYEEESLKFERKILERQKNH